MMAYIDGYGNMRDGSPPPYDNTNGQNWDPEPWLPTPHKPPRLRARNYRHDVQHCPPGYWATKEGALLRIRAMSDRHIENSLKFMEKRARSRAMIEAFAAGRYAETAPDGAADAADEASRELFEMAHDKNIDLTKLARLVFPKYRELEAERAMRTPTMKQLAAQAEDAASA